jgi:hypothetical protein
MATAGRGAARTGAAAGAVAALLEVAGAPAEATPVTVGTATAGWASLTAAAAASTTFSADARPACASALGATGNPPACAHCGTVITTAVLTTATADQTAPRTCRPRLAIFYDGARGMVSFMQIPTPLRSP